ncbi:MAG: ABC transporter permease [Anaerolineae bacterium]|nr:ABC transporter permease [Anaerolineae bacterium]
MRAFLAVLRNEALQLSRDVWYLLLMTFGAMVTLLTLAYTLSTDVEGVVTLVVDLDRGRHSRTLIRSLDNDGFFALEMALCRDEAERRLQQGSADVAVLIPAGYSERIDRGEAVSLPVLIDGSAPGVAELAASRIVTLVDVSAQRLIVERMARSGLLVTMPLDFRPRVRYNSDLKTVVSVAPALMGVVLIVPAVGAAGALGRERERGSFEMVISTPLGRWPLLLGRICPYIIVGLFDIGLFTALGYLVFDVPLRGNLGLFVLLGIIYILATASSGVLIAQFLPTQHSAMIVTFMLFGITPVYLSNIFFPVSSMPAWLQLESALLPATHFTTIARAILLKGVGWEVLWPNALALLVTGVVMSVLAYLRFQKKLT